MSSFAHKGVFFFKDSLKNFSKIFLKIFLKNLLKIITGNIFVVGHSAQCQIKENCRIYLLCQFCLCRTICSIEILHLSKKKLKTKFLSNISKSGRLTSTFSRLDLYGYDCQYQPYCFRQIFLGSRYQWSRFILQYLLSNMINDDKIDIEKILSFFIYTFRKIFNKLSIEINFRSVSQTFKSQSPAKRNTILLKCIFS